MPASCRPTSSRVIREIVFTSAETGRSWMRTLRGLLPVEGPSETKRDGPPRPLADLYREAVDRVERGPSSDAVPAAVRRFVEARSGGRCEVPGCHSTLAELHHRNPVALGGSHHPDNLAGVCPTHHSAAHSGGLDLEGEPESWGYIPLGDPLARNWVDIEYHRRASGPADLSGPG